MTLTEEGLEEALVRAYSLSGCILEPEGIELIKLQAKTLLAAHHQDIEEVVRAIQIETLLSIEHSFAETMKKHPRRTILLLDLLTEITGNLPHLQTKPDKVKEGDK